MAPNSFDAQETPPTVLIVIPARGGSRRLPLKNIQPVLGVPMVLRVALEAQRSRYKPAVVVSSDSEVILDLCREAGIDVVVRPAELARDDTPKMDAIEHGVTEFVKQNGYQPDIVVSLQANSPELLASDLDAAIDFFRFTLYPGYPIKEVISVGPDNIQNAAFRIMTFRTVFQRTLSTYVGIYITDYLDIHDETDLREVEERIRRREAAASGEQSTRRLQRSPETQGPSIVVFLSDEGFGHIVRQEALVREFLRRLPAAQVTAVTHARLAVLQQKFGDRLQYIDRSNNLHTVKTAEGNLDVAGSIKVLREYPERSTQWLNEVPSLLPPFDFAISDFVPEAFELCARIGKPCYGVAHFTWDWFFEQIDRPDAPEIELMREYMHRAQGLFFPPLTEDAILERHSDNAHNVSFIINEFAEIKRTGSPPPGTLSCLLMDNGTNTLSRLIEGALPQLASIRGIDFVVAVDSLSAESVRLVERAANLSPARGLKEMHSHIPLVDFVVARGGFNTITECLITRTPALLVEEGGNPEVSANIRRVTRDGLAASITPDEFATSLAARVRHFVAVELNAIRQRLAQADFENSGPAEICEEILRQWRKS